MDRDRLVVELTEVLDGSVRDNAWEPDTLLGYLAEAQDVFCEDTGFFIDKRNFTIETEIGVRSYELDDRIIEVKDVYNSAGGRLGHVSEQSKDWGSNHDSQYLVPDNYLQQGPVREWQADEETGILTFVQEPIAVETFTLRVHRYPLYDLDDEDFDGEGNPAQPEIPKKFRRALVEYAAAKALMHHDLEQQDPVKSAEHMAAYQNYARRGKRARIRREGVRRGVAPSPVYATRP